MKTKQVNQYQCDYCGTKKYSAPAMKKHERYCTMNPNRECRMCQLIGEDPLPIPETIATLPPVERKDSVFGPEQIPDYSSIIKAIAKIKDEHNCPACILALIRQMGMTGYEFGFDYKAECKSFWTSTNEDREE